MKYFAVSLLVAGLFFFSVVSAGAQIETYTKEVVYEAGILDNEFSSGVIAKEQVKRMLFNEMADDAEIQSSGFGIPVNRTDYIAEFSTCVDIKPLLETWKNDKFYYKAEVTTDVGEILSDFKSLKESGGQTEDILANRELASRALECIERIKEEAKTTGEKAGEREEYYQAVNQLQSADWYEKARFFGFSGNPQKAIDAYSKVIEYNPELAIAYYNRGYYFLTHLKDKEKALSDFQKANQLFFNDAIGDLKSKKYEKCIYSLDYAIKANPKDADAYYQRAACYIGLGQQDKVLENFKTAAKLGNTKAQEILKSKDIQW